MCRWLCTLATLLLFILLDVSAVRPPSAFELNQRGIELGSRNRMDGAMRHFEKACQMEPNVGEYWNNFGMAQLSLGHHLEARESFLKCLAILPGYQRALDSLEQVDAALGTVTEIPKPKEAQRFENTNPRSNLPRITDDAIGSQDSKTPLGSEPFILTNSHASPATLETWDLPYLLETLGADKIVHFYPRNMPNREAKPYKVPLGEAVDFLLNPTNEYGAPTSGLPGTYIHVILSDQEWQKLLSGIESLEELVPPKFMYGLQMNEDQWLSSCFRNEETRDEFLKKTNWRMILIGSRNAGMFNHWDAFRTSSWHAHIRGSKTWHICDPSQSEHMYEIGDVDTFSPDYEKFPKFREARCSEDKLQPGEVIFYPGDYWHQTLIEDDLTITLTSALVDLWNFQKFQKVLEAECSPHFPVESDEVVRTYGSDFSKPVCKDLQQCYAIWHFLWQDILKKDAKANEGHNEL